MEEYDRFDEIYRDLLSRGMPYDEAEAWTHELIRDVPPAGTFD